MISNWPVYNQGSTQRLTLDFEDETGATVAASALTTITGTLYAKLTGAIINSRNALSIAGVNGGEFSGSSLLLTLSAADSPHLGLSPTEDHVLLLAWTYSNGTQGGNEEILLRVRDVGKI